MWFVVIMSSFVLEFRIFALPVARSVSAHEPGPVHGGYTKLTNVAPVQIAKEVDDGEER